ASASKRPQATCITPRAFASAARAIQRSRRCAWCTGSSASRKPSRNAMALHRFAFRAMAAANELQLNADDAHLAREAAGSAIEEVARIEAKYSRYLPDRVVS